MKYITTSQTPVYVQGSNGFFRMVRSVPSGMHVQFVKNTMDLKSDRAIGVLASGEVMYLDALTQILDEVEVKSTRLWDWLLYSALAAGTIYFILKK